MPRLRYKKSYDFSLYSEEEEQENESTTGQSWLSNAVIASQLSESRIKTAIQALKAQIAVLENELLSRRLTRSHETLTNWNKIGRTYRKKDGSRDGEASFRQGVGRNFGINTKFKKIRKTLIKLGVKDVDALIKEWDQINNKK